MNALTSRPHAGLISLACVVAGLIFGVTGAQAGTGPSPFAAGARVDVDATGQAVVAWAGPHGVRAVTGDRLGGFSAPATLSSSTDVGSSPSVAIDDAGDALVVWETTRLLAPTCRQCDGRVLSTGVWATMRPAGGTFGPAVALAGPAPDRGGSQAAYPRMAMSATGQAVIAWSDADGVLAVLRAPGAAFGAPQRVEPSGHTVQSAAIGGDGEAFLGDAQGMVVARPAGAAFGAPQGLPGALGYTPVLVAANAAGDALAAYPVLGGFRALRRPAGGTWGAPVALTALSGAGLRAAALTDGGEGVLTSLAIDGPRAGQRTGLYTSILPPASDQAPAVQRITPADQDAGTSFDGAGLDADGAGDMAIGWDHYDVTNLLFGRRVAQVAVRLPGGTFGHPVTLTPAGAEHNVTDAPDVAIDPGGELLATWTDQDAGQARLSARWITATAASAPVVLDAGPAVQLHAPVIATGHVAQVGAQTPVKSTAHGFIPVLLHCVSTDHLACKGMLTLTRGVHRIRAGRTRFTIAAGHAKHIYVGPNHITRKLLRRHRTLTLVATAVTTKPGGANGTSSGGVHVKLRAATARR